MQQENKYSFETLEAKNKQLTLIARKSPYNERDRPIFLHSKINPQREAQSFAQKALAEMDIRNVSAIIILGMGLGYHIKALMELIPQECQVLVLEKEKEIYSLCPKENLQNCKALVSASDIELDQAIQKLPTAKVQILMHRSSVDLFSEYYDSLFKQLQTLISHKDINIATLTRFEEIWLKNFLHNLPFIFSSKPISSILNVKNGAKGLKGALVGGGPSLNAVMPDLKKSSDYLFIACVDTALKPLLDNNIKPDIVFTVDAQFVNSLYLLYSLADIPLVAEPTCHPLGIRKWPGQLYFFSSPFHYVQWAEKILGKFGDLKHGGSVSTNAFDFMVQAGFDEIYLVGQDLAFIQNRAHASGTILDENMYSRETRINTREKALMNQLLALPPIEKVGMDGNKTFTNQKLFYFKKWFDREIPASEANVKNTSPWGLPLANAPYRSIPVEELLKNKFHKGAHPFIRNLSNEQSNKKGIKVIKEKSISLFLDELSSLSVSIKELLTILDSGIEKASRLKTLAFNQGAGQQKKHDPAIAKTLADLDEIDNQINKFEKTNELLSPVMQRTIQPIIEGAKDYLSPEERQTPLMENAAITLHLYKGMKKALGFSFHSINKGLKLSKI